MTCSLLQAKSKNQQSEQLEASHLEQIKIFQVNLITENNCKLLSKSRQSFAPTKALGIPAQHYGRLWSHENSRTWKSSAKLWLISKTRALKTFKTWHKWGTLPKKIGSQNTSDQCPSTQNQKEGKVRAKSWSQHMATQPSNWLYTKQAHRDCNNTMTGKVLLKHYLAQKKRSTSTKTVYRKSPKLHVCHSIKRHISVVQVNSEHVTEMKKALS